MTRHIKRRTVTIQNVGPIERLSIPLPDAGVVVLRGRNGVGKSHALQAIDSLIARRGRPPCRDGSDLGVVEGLGARLTIGRSLRRSGEVEVLTLEGKLDVSRLVDPQIDDPEAADRVRIKALLQLTGQTADVTAFAEIMPDGVDLGALVPGHERADDAVVLAGQIKRALEAEARRMEKQAEELRARVAVYEEDGVPADVPEDIDLIRADAERGYREAVVALQVLETRQESAAQTAARQAEARRALAELEAIGGDTPEELARAICELDEKIHKLEAALAIARQRRQELVARQQEAASRAERIAALRRVLSEPVHVVSDEEIAAAQARVDAAKRAFEDAVALHKQASRARELRELREQLAAAETWATQLRDAAHATDHVLARMVAQVTPKLSVERGRLVTPTERGLEPFGELSAGERWRLALEIAAAHVGRGGLVTVPQEAWESLDPVNRHEVAQIARELGVVIITAEADDHEAIVPEVFHA